MGYFFFDLETTAKGPDNSPEAHYIDNHCVVAGWKWKGRNDTGNILDLAHAIQAAARSDPHFTLVAHNLKFDLKYLLRDCGFLDFNKYKYICTMTADYRTSGHHRKFTSLEKLCDMYDVKYKKSLDLGALIKSGVCVSDIDMDDLIEYLEDDVNYLEDVFVEMVGHAGWVDYDYDYILPLAKMELNGLPLNIQKAESEWKRLTHKASVSKAGVEMTACSMLRWDDGATVRASDFKALAPRTISYLLTGYPKHGIGGKNDKRKIVFEVGMNPVLTETEIKNIWGKTKPSETLGYPINASVLDSLVPKYALVVDYKDSKDATKLVSTYIEPFLAEAKITGGTVHPKINTCSTNTGRLSSSNPNGQNIPPSMRALFESTMGQMYEIDFAQLEMIGAATLSGDKQMLDDLCKGKDIHFESGRTVFGWKTPADMTKGERRVVKGVNFGLLYGGGAAGISANTGTDKSTVQRLIDSFYQRYPRVQDWQDRVYKDVTSEAWVVDTKDGETYKGATWQAPCVHGERRYYFEESASPKWKQIQDGRKFSFKPTETKNYPIQGFAGGDIVMKALVVLDDILTSGNCDAKLRMTVHDSIVLDWHNDKEPVLFKVMTEVCKIVRDNLGIRAPLKFDIEHDTYWL